MHKNIASDTSITGIFKESGNVTNLRKGPGDIAHEGRSGHSLKFGSTVDGFNQNIKGPDRSPFLILSNGRTGLVNFIELGEHFGSAEFPPLNTCVRVGYH